MLFVLWKHSSGGPLLEPERPRGRQFSQVLLRFATGSSEPAAMVWEWEAMGEALCQQGSRPINALWPQYDL